MGTKGLAQTFMKLREGALRVIRDPRTRVLGLVVVLVAYGFPAVKRQLATGNDFPTYLDAARALLEGRSPYRAGPGLEGYVYLPFFALVLSPLAFLPEAAATWIWYGLNIALTVASVRLARALIRWGFGDAYATWAVVVSLIVHSRFFLGNYDLGQANLVMLVLLLWSVKLAAVDGRSWRSGWPLGVAAVIKPHAIVLVAPFLLRRRWGMIAGVGLAIGVAGAVLPSLILGPGQARRVTVGWYERVLVPARQETLQGSAAHDQSPQAALRRLVVDEPAVDDTRVNLWSLSNEDYVRLKRVLQLVLALVLAAAWMWRGRGKPSVLLIDVALGFIGMLVLFGYLIRPHFVMLLLPGAILALLWRGGSSALPNRRVSSILLALAAALIFFTTSFIAGRTIQQWTLTHSIITVATFVQLTLLIVARLRLGGGGMPGPGGLGRS